MSCFDAIIGLRELDINATYWINDCLGITTEMAGYLQNSDNETLREFWIMIKTRTEIKYFAEFSITFNQYFSSCCKNRNEIDAYIKSIICANKGILAVSYLNLLCKQMLLEKKHSSNINFYTTVDSESTNELIRLYTEEFDKVFVNSVKTIQVPETLSISETARCLISTTYSLPS